MQYGKVVEGRFISRPNRFIAKVLVAGREVDVHVKNTGRCKELLIPDCRVFLEEFDSAKRKTAYDLISVYKGDTLINMDSQAPNKVFREWLDSSEFAGLTIQGEYRRGDSRFDFYLEGEGRKIFIEVKGVTLEEDGIAKFPDAPTIRGIKHIKGLTALTLDGYECYIAFVIQMKGCGLFVPHAPPHEDFRQALVEAQQAGVGIIVLDCLVGRDFLVADQIIPYDLLSEEVKLSR